MNLALLVNPAARSGAHTGAAMAAATRLRAHDVRTSVISGGSARESRDLLRAALDLGADAVAVVGGDGTVNLAINELAGSPVPLGIIPSGTGNDFAASLGLKELDATAAADAIAAGATRRVDLARADRGAEACTRFATILATGFDSKVNDRANGMRWPTGGSRYNIAILIEFLRLARIPYEIEWDDAAGATQRFSGDLLMAAVANGPTYGGGIPIAPQADLEDGLLDLVLVRPAGRIRLLGLLGEVYRANHEGSTEVSIHRARCVRVSAPGLTGYADGDPFGSLPLEVSIEPRALTVFAPSMP